MLGLAPHGGIRAGFLHYNDAADAERLLAAVAELQELKGPGPLAMLYLKAAPTTRSQARSGSTRRRPMITRAEAVTGTRVGARDFSSARSIARATSSASPPNRDERALVDLARGLRDRRVELRVRAVAAASTPPAAVEPNSVRIRPGSMQITSMPNRRDLHPQRVADRLDRVLGRVVGAAARERQPPAHRGDVDDLARARLAHPRQHELGQPQQAEDVGLELAAHGSIGSVSSAPDCE